MCYIRILDNISGMFSYWAFQSLILGYARLVSLIKKRIEKNVLSCWDGTKASRQYFLHLQTNDEKSFIQ